MLARDMSTWKWINVGLLMVLLYVGVAKLAALPPFGATGGTRLPSPVDIGEIPAPEPKPHEGARPEELPLPPPTVPVGTRALAQCVDNAKLWLIQHQRKDGSWGEMRVLGAYGPFHLDRPGFHQAGPTALSLYALLKSGVPLNNPAVRKGFAYLEKHHVWPATSPETSMVLMAVTATASHADMDGSKGRLDTPYRKWAQDLVKHLIDKRTATGWRYNYVGRYEPPQIGGREDMISTHLAALALLSAQDIGIEIEDKVWLDILRFTLAQQEPAAAENEGADVRGFAYVLGHTAVDEGKPTGGTTACGVANLLMARSVLNRRGTHPQALQEVDAKLEGAVSAGLAAGMAWLEQNWSPYETPKKQEGSKVLHHHWLWALETAMDLNPMQPGRLGPYTWHNDIARQLIWRQSDDGSWHNQDTWEPADVIDTALAILVLERASRSLMLAR